MFQAFPYKFPQGPVIDLKTGRFTTDGQFFNLSLFNRTGGSDGIGPMVSAPLTAAGNSQATALLLAADWNDVETVPVGSGVIFPSMKPGTDIWVFNGNATSVNVYPFVGAAIDQLAVNAAFVLAQNKLRCFQCWGTAQFRSYGN